MEKCDCIKYLKLVDLYGADFCYRELPDKLDPFDWKSFSDNPMLFYAGATDVDTGKCAYHLCTGDRVNDMLWLRASASMPIVSRPVLINGHRYLDGGITDAVPYRFMMDQGYDRNVVILTQPACYRKKQEAGPMIRFFLRKMPMIREAMEHRHEMYNQQMDAIDRMEAEKEALVIRPPEALRIGHTEKDPDELERVYQIGRLEGRKRLNEVRAWLA